MDSSKTISSTGFKKSIGNGMQEHISAFADGELAPAAQAQVLAALRSPAERAVWDDYHHIGDILRSVEMAAAVRPDFAARMAARLESEPTYLAAAADLVQAEGLAAAGRQHWAKRFAMPGAAVAAALVLAVVAVPRTVGGPFGGGGEQAAVSKADAVALGGAIVLRDARMEEYLLAHQRFSPSVFSTAQFARSATFATDSLK